MTSEELHDEEPVDSAADSADVDAAAANDGVVDEISSSAGMAREVKVGLTVISGLMMVLAGVVYVRMGMPGIKSKQPMDAAPNASQHAAVPQPLAPPQVLAEPASPTNAPSGAVDPFAPGETGDRYAAQAAAMPQYAPDAQAMPQAPASAPTAPAGDPAAAPVDPFGPAGAVRPVAATESAPPAPLANQEIPPEPTTDAPLAPTAEPQLQAPQTGQPPATNDPQGVNPAAHEPPLAEPQNAPYGSRYTDDRYGAAQEPAAPAEHAAPHVAPQHNLPAQFVPPHAAPTHNPAEAGAHNAPPPHHDLPYEHADLAQRPTRDGSYVVEPNDSFWTISQKVYGAPGFFKALQRHNRKPGTPNVGLSVGEKISTPPVETLRRDYPNLCPKPRTGGATAYNASSHGAPHTGRVYVVQEGDTLFDIARYELGKASRWAEVYELNRNQLGDDYNHLSPGMRLSLPSDAANDTDNITSRPATPYK